MGDQYGRTWTTLDEVVYMRGLAAQGKLRELRTCLRYAPHRVWFGLGMSVNVAEVIKEGERLLAMARLAESLKGGHSDVL